MQDLASLSHIEIEVFSPLYHCTHSYVMRQHSLVGLCENKITIEISKDVLNEVRGFKYTKRYVSMHIDDIK